MNALWRWWRKRVQTIEGLQSEIRALKVANGVLEDHNQELISRVNHLLEVQQEKDGIRRSHADSLANLTPQVRDWERYYRDHHTMMEKVHEMVGKVLAYAQSEILIGEKQLELNREALSSIKELFHATDSFLFGHRRLKPDPLPQGESPYKEPLLDVEELLETQEENPSADNAENVPFTDQAGKPLEVPCMPWQKIYPLEVCIAKPGFHFIPAPAAKSDRADSDPGERPQPEPIRSYPSYDQPLIDVENHPEFRPE